MGDEQVQKGRGFLQLHQADGIFVMPNAWNAGSACMLEAAGFSAIGTTSAGIAFCLGLSDYEGALTRDAALEETGRIARAVAVPVSADAENGYGHEPEDVAESIRRFASSGAVGASIEDYSASYGKNLYERKHSVERIAAARASADALEFSFTLTARAECYLVGHSNAFEESVIRANLYRDAGADCLFVPGVKDPDTIAALVREIDGPLNVVMGLVGNSLTVSQLEELGVKRVSIGGSLTRATFGLIRRAADELRQDGTFKFADEQISDDELCQFFSKRMKE
ncbi:MAG: isocitrate lyase/phosphoenolpyruvate mutase family protein [Gammaproteobacteria bacterium]|nr:isocitrate lyase/phosphoenolpyruvate mutase family protein [Gammaproteobacteria bacterium]